MNRLIGTTLATLALAAGAALADDAHHRPAAQAAEVGTAMSEGEVRKVDKDNGRITLRHGEIRNLGMPGMTMVFRVKDRALLDAVEPGAKVRFRAEQADGALVVTAIEPAG